MDAVVKWTAIPNETMREKVRKDNHKESQHDATTRKTNMQNPSLTHPHCHFCDTRASRLEQSRISPGGFQHHGPGSVLPGDV